MALNILGMVDIKSKIKLLLRYSTKISYESTAVDLDFLIKPLLTILIRKANSINQSTLLGDGKSSGQCQVIGIKIRFTQCTRHITLNQTN